MPETLSPNSSNLKSTGKPWQRVVQREFPLGIGAFIGVGTAVNLAGSGALAALIVAAIAALWADLNAAQLTAAPLSAADRFSSPWLGFTANWALLLAKATAAAVAALGFAGYLLHALGQANVLWLVPIALCLTAGSAFLLYLRLLPAKLFQILLLAVTLLVLLFCFGIGLLKVLPNSESLSRFTPASSSSIANMLQASALLFFAYAGHPSPHPDRSGNDGAVKTTVWVKLLTLLLYLGAAGLGIGAIGAQAFGDAADTYVSSLAVALQQISGSGSSRLVATGAAVVLAGVVFNLSLQAARLLQMMAQQQDVPRLLARGTGTPIAAIVAVGGTIACLMLMADIQTLWSFGAFASLLYAILVHLAVLKLPGEQRSYPRVFTGISLGVCLFLAVWISFKIWLISLGLIGVGLVWRGINQWVKEQSQL
ncbi:APC family permease [Phormidium tenue FACHB-886]|nr:APC family permease [Phormidium tenue FACHB-886]